MNAEPLSDVSRVEVDQSLAPAASRSAVHVVSRAAMAVPTADLRPGWRAEAAAAGRAGEARMYAHGWTAGVVREGLQALAAEEGLESSGLQDVDVWRWLRGEIYPRESLERLCRLFRCHQAPLGWPPRGNDVAITGRPIPRFPLWRCGRVLPASWSQHRPEARRLAARVWRAAMPSASAESTSTGARPSRSRSSLIRSVTSSSRRWISRARFRELIDHLLRHPDDVRDPVLDIGPVHAQVAAQPVTEMGLVQVAGGLGARVHEPGVEGAPAAVLAPAHVREQDVRVEVRVVRA